MDRHLVTTSVTGVVHYLRLEIPAEVLSQHRGASSGPVESEKVLC